MRKHVSISNDLPAYMDYVPFIITFHLYTSGITLVSGVIPNWEFSVPIYWPPGAVTGSHKLTSTVKHHALSIAQDGHDLGPMLAHIPALLDDVLTPGHIIGSKRKAVFSAATVKADSAPIACCTMIELGPPTPMNPCSLIPLPLIGTGGTAVHFNTAVVGIMWADVFAGTVSLVVDSIWGAICELTGNAIPDWVPNPLEIWGGLATVAIQAFGGDVDAETELEFDLGAAEVTVTLGRTADGRYSIGVSEEVGFDGLLPHAGSSQTFEFGGGEPAQVLVDGEAGAAGSETSGDFGHSFDGDAPEPSKSTAARGSSAPSWESLPEL